MTSKQTLTGNRKEIIRAYVKECESPITTNEAIEILGKNGKGFNGSNPRSALSACYSLLTIMVDEDDLKMYKSKGKREILWYFDGDNDPEKIIRGTPVRKYLSENLDSVNVKPCSKIADLITKKEIQKDEALKTYVESRSRSQLLSEIRGDLARLRMIGDLGD